MSRGGETDGGASPPGRFRSQSRLGLLAVLFAATIVFAVRLGAIEFSIHQVMFLVLSVGLVFCVAFRFARKAVLAAAIAFVPLGAALDCAAVVQFAHLPLVPPVWLYAFGVAAATFVVDGFVDGILAEEDASTAAWQALRNSALPLLAASVTAVAVTVAAAFPASSSPEVFALTTLGAYAVTVVTALLAIPLIIGGFAPDEPFVARTNRAREARAACAWRVAMVSVPRWGMSISGVTMVIATLAWFGAASFYSLGNAEGLLPSAIAACVVGAVAFAVPAAWRDGTGLFLGLAVMVLLARWAAALFGRPIYVATEGVVLVLPGLFAVAFRTRQLRAGGQETSIARLRAIEKTSGTVLFSALAAASALLPAIGSGAETALPVLIAGSTASVLSAPAIATALESIVPRYRSVEELYTRRRLSSRPPPE